MAFLLIRMASVALLAGASTVHDASLAPLPPTVGRVVKTRPIPTNMQATPSGRRISEERGAAATMGSTARNPPRGSAKESKSPSVKISSSGAGRVPFDTTAKQETQALQSLSKVLTKYKDTSAQIEVILRETGKAEKGKQDATKAALGAESDVRKAKGEMLKAAQKDIKSDPLLGQKTSHDRMISVESRLESAQKQFRDAKAHVEAADKDVRSLTAKAVHVLEKQSHYEEEIKDVQRQVEDYSMAARQAREQQIHEEKVLLSKAQEFMKRAALTKAQLAKVVSSSHGKHDAASRSSTIKGARYGQGQ